MQRAPGLKVVLSYHGIPIAIMTESTVRKTVLIRRYETRTLVEVIFEKNKSSNRVSGDI